MKRFDIIRMVAIPATELWFFETENVLGAWGGNSVCGDAGGGAISLQRGNV